jgi:hypothetical protein
LSADDFADMYAQTIAYGLLTARVSRYAGPGEPAAVSPRNLTDLVPITNPFLKDLLGMFLTVGGRKGKLDFDELGVNDVVDLLRDANMEAILRDFGLYTRKLWADYVIAYDRLTQNQLNTALRQQASTLTQAFAGLFSRRGQGESSGSPSTSTAKPHSGRKISARYLPNGCSNLTTKPAFLKNSANWSCGFVNLKIPRCGFPLKAAEIFAFLLTEGACRLQTHPGAQRGLG